MIRTLIGGIVGGLILFVVGALFWATPLAGLAIAQVDDASSAAVQASLSDNLAGSGTGTYVVPDPNTAAGTAAYGRGPIATIHFYRDGASAEDPAMMIQGLIFAAICGLLIAFALAAVSRGRDFAQLARLVILFSLGAAAWTVLSQPIFNPVGWGPWVYVFLADAIGLSLAGLVISRWFLPREQAARTAASAAPEASPS